MVSVCLPSDALSQYLPSYLGFSYLGRRVSLHGCSSKVQPLLRTLDEGYLLMAAPPDLKRGIAPLGPPAPAQLLLLGSGVAPPGHLPWPWARGSSSCFSHVQFYATLCSLPGSSIHGIFQARTLEWVAMPSSRGSYQPRGWTLLSPALAGRFFTTSTTWEALKIHILNKN